MTAPVITLLTDFGVSDHYVGAMKGVVCSICPEARIVDISHAVPAYGIAQAAYLLSQSWPYFPEGTVHVVVVDPGVGSARRPIIIHTAEHYFVGPDNGVFSMLPLGEIRHITSDLYFRHPVSQTFHGRDIFAPVAAHLASGIAPAKMGGVVQNEIRLSLANPTRNNDNLWTGTILHIDHFGNVVTNFRAANFSAFRLKVGVHSIEDFARNYADAPPGPFLIEGSGGYWEISASNTSAGELLNVKVGQAVELSFLVPQNAGIGYL